ncbi:MAG: TIGR03086 family protein, partial [bacterium]|nr:TIGR03086 family protein [bacterium]
MGADIEPMGRGLELATPSAAGIGRAVDFHTGSLHTSGMEAVEALIAANIEFESRLRQVATGDWTRSTPCSEWDVRGLVNHVLLGTRMSIQILAGMSVDEIISGLNDDLMTDTDPVKSFRALADDMVDGFSGPGGLDGNVDHPAGQFPRSVFVGFRVADAAVHAWDLATATGDDVGLNAELVQWLWDDAQPQREMLSASGMFGDSASGDVPEDAPLQLRYLDLMGRRP